MVGLHVIGQAGAAHSDERLEANGAVTVPTPYGPFTVPLNIEASRSEGLVDASLGVAYTEVDSAEGDLNQLRFLANVQTDGGDTRVSAEGCELNVQNNTWAMQGCVGYNFEDEATFARAGVLRTVGPNTALGLMVSRNNLGSEGNTSVDAVLRHDMNLFGEKLRAEALVGQTLEGGLAYGEPFTRNDGNTHAGLRLELTDDRYYTNPLLGGEAGIAGGWFVGVEGGYEEGEAQVPTPFGMAPVDTEATFVRAYAGVRF